MSHFVTNLEFIFHQKTSGKARGFLCPNAPPLRMRFWKILKKEVMNTILLVEKGAKAELLKQVLASNPIEKPALHKGGEETDDFIVYISVDDADEIIDSLGYLEAHSVSPEGYTTPGGIAICFLS